MFKFKKKMISIIVDMHRWLITYIVYRYSVRIKKTILRVEETMNI